MMYGTVLTIACMVAFGVAFMYSGVYNVAASSEHTSAVYWALEQGMRASVRRHASKVQVPTLDEATLAKGAHCFDELCVQCHGGPGKGSSDIGKGMLPIAKSLVQTARDWPPEYIYWVTRNGIRMAGMPAWEFRLADRDLWAITSFIDRELPGLDARQYQQRIASAGGEQCERPSTRAAPDARRGLMTIRQYGCHACHIIPGVTGPAVHVGPSLVGFSRRPLIAGAIPNTPENLVRWLRDPQKMRPQTLMPGLGVTEQHARDMQAYLASLD
jgi:cytochrome c2